MSRHALIVELKALAIAPDRLAQAIHSCWRSQRLADGWVYGLADPASKSSPYLKPLSEFSSAEMERELRLALNDLAGIVDTLEGFEGGHRLEALFESADGRATLLHLRDDAEFVERASGRIHEGWRLANLQTGSSSHDVRLNLAFEELSPVARAITLSNVRVDIEAISGLLASGSG